MRIIDVNMLKEMLISGANNLYNHYPEIDQLNVFPVPDGDTGMNMNLTVTSGAKEIANRNFTSVFELASAFSKGLLMGARGNSGVITSQIFRGFAKALEGKEVITLKDLSKAIENGKTVAYKAVMKPVEGTILTVIRESSAALSEHVLTHDMQMEEAMTYLLNEAKESLNRTPDLLPVLKQVGVVDSGGAGLTKIIEGMALAANNKFVQRLNDVGSSSSPVQQEVPLYAGAQLSEDEEGYGYCTQFILRLPKDLDGKKPFDEKRFKNFLTSHGKSTVLVRDDDIVKVHVHTLTPGNMLNYAQNYGEFVSIQIENMSEEHNNIQNGLKATDMASNIELGKAEQKAEPSKKYGVIAVCSGEGLENMFKELGADYIVSGGQTNNPSTQDFLDAIAAVNAKNVFILPNNSNIVMAASQACDVLEGSDVSCMVIPSKTIPQGLVSILQFNEELEPQENFREMKGALRTVKSGQVTYAIKDTDIDGVHITKDHFMAMMDKTIVSCVKDKFRALDDMLAEMVDEDSAIITIIVGDCITDEEMAKVEETVTAKYGKNVDVDVRKGDQPVYCFLVGVE